MACHKMRFYTPMYFFPFIGFLLIIFLLLTVSFYISDNWDLSINFIPCALVWNDNKNSLSSWLISLLCTKFTYESKMFRALPDIFLYKQKVQCNIKTFKPIRQTCLYFYFYFFLPLVGLFRHKQKHSS